MKNNLQNKFDKALEIFVDKYKNDPNVLAVFVSGSYIHSKPDKNSDLDVYVVLKESKIRERGNTWIDGVEIEYFINPVSQVRCYFKNEIGSKSPSTAHMFVNSKILYQKDDFINKLIEEAEIILDKKIPKMNEIELELSKYIVDDLRKDLEDVYLKGDKSAFYLIANDILVRL